MRANSILNLILIFVLPFLIVLVPIFLGQRFGNYHRERSSNPQDSAVGTVVGAAFALFAFMLAFVFQITTDRLNSRKELLLEEVTNIRTLYLQSGLLKDPIRSEAKNLLVEYVEIRIGLASDNTTLQYGMNRSQQILDRLWEFAETLAEQDRSSEVYALFTTSVNNLITNYNQRITTTLEYRLPVVIIWILGIIAFFSMLTLGYQFGISGKGSMIINMLFAFIFAIVMFLILALDKPELGIAKLNQKPMQTLQRQLQTK